MSASTESVSGAAKSATKSISPSRGSGSSSSRASFAISGRRPSIARGVNHALASLR